MENQIPTLKQIYYNDVIFKSFIQMIYGPLIFWIAIFITEPMFKLIVTAMTVPLSILGILLTIYRYMLIQSTFRDGIQHDGQEFDVVLKESSPKKVFIKHVYLEYDPTLLDK